MISDVVVGRYHSEIQRGEVHFFLNADTFAAFQICHYRFHQFGQIIRDLTVRYTYKLSYISKSSWKARYIKQSETKITKLLDIFGFPSLVSGICFVGIFLGIFPKLEFINWLFWQFSKYNKFIRPSTISQIIVSHFSHFKKIYI